VPFIDDASAAAAVRDTFLGDYRIARQRAACRIWDVPARALRYARTLSDVPVLFVAGGRDHVTPGTWAERVAAKFSRGRVVTIPYLGHAPEGLAHMDCLDSMLLALAADADPAMLDTTCVAAMTPPPFTRPAATRDDAPR
jgi:fermentation-respiration switch protein FrsA (DUF1100 family)